VSPEVEARLAALRDGYVSSLPELLAEFDDAVAVAGEPADEARLRAREIAHRLSGTGALFGLPALTLWGKATERIAVDGPLEQLEAAAATLRALIGSLR
jgi:hypothetical protein